MTVTPLTQQGMRYPHLLILPLVNGFEHRLTMVRIRSCNNERTGVQSLKRKIPFEPPSC